MSRSGYSTDCDYLDLYRASVDRAIKGKRGQAFMKELAAAMDAMPVKRLIAHEIQDETGEVCAIGSVCLARSIDPCTIDYELPEHVGAVMGIARSLAAEIEFENDEADAWNNAHRQNWKPETPEERWVRMRKWVDENTLK